jgi:hypothetical protein
LLCGWFLIKEGYQLQGMLMAGGFPFVAALAPQSTSEGSVVMVMKHDGMIMTCQMVPDSVRIGH